MYFTLSQFQHLMIALFGGLLLMLIIVVGYLSFRLTIRGPQKPVEEERKLYDFPDGLQESEHHIPLFVILLAAGILGWGVFYLIAIGLGWIHVQ